MADKFYETPIGALDFQSLYPSLIFSSPKVFYDDLSGKYFTIDRDGIPKEVRKDGRSLSYDKDTVIGLQK
jgi:hypothetical protein